MDLTEKDKDRYNKLTLPLRVVANALMDCLDRLFNGDCDESQVTESMSKIEAMSDGRYKSSDLLTYDEACSILEMPITNRVGLKKLLDRHGIKQVKIHNQRVGFRRHEIEMLRDEIEKDIRKAGK